jgi:hypothetical protein
MSIAYQGNVCILLVLYSIVIALLDIPFYSVENRFYDICAYDLPPTIWEMIPLSLRPLPQWCYPWTN